MRPSLFTQRRLNLISASLILLGIILTIIQYYRHLQSSLWLLFGSVLSYVIGAVVLFLAQHFRFFIITPRTLTIREDTPKQFTIMPWLNEKDVRWKCILYGIEIELSKPLELVDIIVDREKLKITSEDIANCLKERTLQKNTNKLKCKDKFGRTYFSLHFQEPIETDLNTAIILRIKRSGEHVPEHRPYLEYTLLYKAGHRYLPIFKDSMRIF